VLGSTFGVILGMGKQGKTPPKISHSKTQSTIPTKLSLLVKQTVTILSTRFK